VAVHVCRLNVRCAALVIGDKPFGPRLGPIERRFPPGKPLATARLGLWASLGGQRNIGAAITVDISHAEVVAEARCILIGKNNSLPLIGGTRRLRHAQPDSRARKFPPRLSAVGNEVEAAVAIDIPLEQSMDAIDLVIDESQFPPLVLRL